MQIITALDTRITEQPVVLTIGKFDGVHLGHQALIGAAVRRARERGAICAVLTFDPHPRTVLTPEVPLELLSNISERATLIAEQGADVLLVLPFNQEVMTTPAEQYLRQICAALPLCELWVGEDFALGRKREGTPARLREIGQELGFSVGTVAPVEVDGIVVSASQIRDLLHAGDLAGARRQLGRDYWLRGMVVHGDQRGRTIGFPTANLDVAPNHLVPAYGVYACWVQIETGPHAGTSLLPAVTNVGVRPTVDGSQRRVEAHLLDWSGDLYGATLRLIFIQRLRDEQRFASLADLVAQIEHDVAHACEQLGSVGSTPHLLYRPAT